MSFHLLQLLLDDTGSSTYYDRWCDRSILRTRIELSVAFPYAFVLPILFPYLPLERPQPGYYFDGRKDTSLHRCPAHGECTGMPFHGFPIDAHQQSSIIPSWEKWVALLLVFLAATKCPPQSGLSFRLFAYLNDETQRLSVSAISQTMQLVICTLLVVGDYLRHGNAPLFWMSLALWLVPAVRPYCRLHTEL